MSDRPIKLYIEDIREAIQKIETYTRGMALIAFKNDPKTIDAVTRNIEVRLRRLRSAASFRYIPTAESKPRTVPTYVGAGTGVIGEAAKHIPSEIRLKHVEIPWKEIIGTRSKVIHEYFVVSRN